MKELNQAKEEHEKADSGIYTQSAQQVVGAFTDFDQFFLLPNI